jgi:hypothetical protein
MANEVRTVFSVETAQALRNIDAYEERLKSLSTLAAPTDKLQAPGADVAIKNLQSLDRQLLASQKNSFSLASSFDKLAEVNRGDGFAALTKSAESFKNQSIQIIERLAAIDSAIAKKPAGDILKTFAEKTTADFASLQKRAGETQTSFQSLSSTRLDAGQLGNLTKEIVKASERSRILTGDITNIKNELANPNRKSSIGFLTDELRGAEREADQLNRKLSTLPSQNSAAGTKSSGKRRGNSEFNRALLEVADDFVPAGYNRPFNAVSKELLAVSAVSATTLLTFGAIAVAGAAVVKVTQNIREESERRLKAEELIQGAINRQIISQREGLQNLQKLRIEATADRQFNRDLSAFSVDELKNRRSAIEKLQTLTPATLPVLENGKVISKPNEAFDRNSKALLALDAQIEQTRISNQKKADDSFSQRFESWKMSQENAIEAEKRRREEIEKTEKKRREEIEKGKAKVIELGKVYNTVFDSLFAKTNASNPFVSLFSEGDKAVSELRKNLAGLSPELQAVATQMQQKLNADALFSARLDTKLKVFDLKDEAEQFRNFKEKPFAISDPNKFFSDFIEAGLKQIAAAVRRSNGTRYNLTGSGSTTQGFSQSNENPLIRYNSNIFTDKNGKQFTNGFSQSDARNDLLNVYERENTFGGSYSRQRTLADLNNDEKQKYISSLNNADDKDLQFQDRLQKQITLAQGSGFLSPGEQALVDKKLVALTSVDPSRLNDSERNVAAAAREREAARSQNAENEAKIERAKDREVQNKLALAIDKLAEKAGKEGIKGIENIIRLIDDRSEGKSELKKAPGADDVRREAQKASNDAYKGGTFFELAGN